MNPSYYLELRVDGDLVRPLPQWWRGRIEQRLNRPHRFTVHLPYDSTLSSELAPTAELWVLNDSFEVVNKFIPRMVDESGPAGYEIKLDCLDIMGQLGREWVSSYTTVPDESPEPSPIPQTKTVSEILADLLAMQDITPAITVDTVEPAIGDLQRRLDLERMSILAALAELHRDVGGYYWVDPDRGLHWTEDRGEALGQQIRLGKNLVNIERRRDFGGMANRVYAYGGGDGPDTITATVEDAASIASHGLHTGEYHNQRVNTPEILTEHAQAILAHSKEPVVSYTVGAVDLSAAAGDKHAFDYLALGNRYRAIDPVLGVDTEVRAVVVKRVLDNPTDNEVELANKRAELADLFVEERRERRAAQAHNPIEYAIDPGGQLDEWAGGWNTAEWDEGGLHYDRAGERIGDALAPGGAIDEGLTDTAESDMASLPFVARLFTGADLAAINDMAGSVSYPDLVFRDDEDFALTTDDPENVLHVRLAGAWVEVSGEGGELPDEMMGHVHHGSDTTVERPTGYSAVMWVGSVEPDNWINEDLWVDES